MFQVELTKTCKKSVTISYTSSLWVGVIKFGFVLFWGLAGFMHDVEVGWEGGDR